MALENVFCIPYLIFTQVKSSEIYYLFIYLFIGG